MAFGSINARDALVPSGAGPGTELGAELGTIGTSGVAAESAVGLTEAWMDASGGPICGCIVTVGPADELAETSTDVDGDGFRIVVKVALGAIGADGDGGSGAELDIDACTIETCVDGSCAGDRDVDGLVVVGGDAAAAAADCAVLLGGTGETFGDV